MTTVAQLNVDITADTTSLNRGMSGATSRLNGFQENAQRLVMGITGAFAGIGVAAVHSAVNWESAFVNVEKTVAGTPEELAALENSLREMAQNDVLGAMTNAHETLAQIASSAGALGVATPDIDEFTMAVASLAIAADDVSAEEIATAAAQFANVTGMDIAGDIDNFSNAIARLGNEGATTEGQVLSFSNRLSTLGTMGFEPDQILAYGAAMASLGLTAELGSTNFVKSVTDMVSAAATGAPELQGFADIAGVTAEQFANLAIENPEEAMNAFVEGLSAMESAAQLVALDDLNITGMEQQRVLMTLASGYDTLTQSLDTAGSAWETGNDALDEAARKSDTTQGGINQLMNNLNDLAITIGDRLLPGINDMVEGLTSIIDGDFSGLGDIGMGIASILDNFLGTDMQTGFQAFIDAMDMLPQVISLVGIAINNWVESAGNGISIFFDNIKRSIERFFLEIQIRLVEWVSGFRQTILDATGGTVDIAPEMNVNLSNLSVQASSMDFADQITRAIQSQMQSGDLNLADAVFTDQFGREMNAQMELDALSLMLPDAQEMAASGFGLEARQTIEDALRMAITEGDEGAIETLTPLAMLLEIDVDQIQADLQRQMSENEFPVTVTANMTLIPGLIDTSAAQMALSGAGFGTGATVVVNSYGTNPRQLADQVQTASGNRGRGGEGRR